MVGGTPILIKTLESCERTQGQAEFRGLQILRSRSLKMAYITELMEAFNSCWPMKFYNIVMPLLFFCGSTFCFHLLGIECLDNCGFQFKKFWPVKIACCFQLVTFLINLFYFKVFCDKLSIYPLSLVFTVCQLSSTGMWFSISTTSR